MNRITIVAVSAAAAVVLAAGGWYAYQEMQPVGQESLYSIDVTDPTEVAPEAENIFLGEVVKDSGVETVSDVDSRTYRVKVKELIRGSLNGEVTVTEAVDVYDSRRAYSVGETYVFATNSWAKPENGHAQLYLGPLLPADASAAGRWRDAAALPRTR